ncbi:Metal-nicotianamine transporter YSL3-like protein [Glycine soja]|uniref:Metal-nicotianamine transporter YSL3-like protein n=1 Tax=Glycine soja TaxID=3848 RepID=A0A0B2P9C6_GLYSO|nr:Metal-nicotianamine transporter YSL3-like protein [Glycine soja]
MNNNEELDGIQNCDNDDIEKAGLEELEEQSGVASWTRQITIRGLITSFIIGIVYSVIVMKLNLSTGLVPNLNVSAALLGFVLVRAWIMLLEKANVVSKPFTRQENTIIQTCAVACYSTAFGGGFGSHLLGLNRKTYEQAGVDTKGNTPITKEPGIGWMTAFLFVTYFVGLSALIPLRKMMIIDYKLTYPTGTATAVLINGFHTPKGDEMAKKQVHGFLKFFSFSFLWSFFQWFYAGDGDQCGFSQFPTFGLKAWKNSFYFDFSMNYVGAGMICSHLVNLSLLLGAVLSWGVMWPLIRGLKGQWFPESLSESSMKSLNGYKNMAYNYGKVALFVLAALGGKSHGVVAGLVGCGVIKSLVSTSSDLMQDFKTGHLTFASPRSMLLSQAIGTAIGCVLAPLTFFLFYKAFDVGNPDGDYKAPYAIIYRNMAILGVEGFSALPHHCLQLCCGFFAFAVATNLVRDLNPKNIGRWIPLPMAMAVPFVVGGYFAIDMCMGSLVVYAWQTLKSKEASLMVPAAASGLICGDGFWILPSSILALFKVHPPICMRFLPTK